MGAKKGRKIVYAFESITFGKIWSVPSFGPVSLSASQPWNVRNTVALAVSQRSVYQRVEIGWYCAYLVGAAVEGALGVDPVLEVVRVVLAPVPS